MPRNFRFYLHEPHQEILRVLEEKAPAALINARFNTQGKLSPRPIIDGRFELLDSKMAGEPLAGRGQVSIDWPRIPQADIQLTAGPNKLSTKGAFGRPGDKLLIDEPDEVKPYRSRFTEIWAEGGAPVTPTTLGL